MTRPAPISIVIPTYWGPAATALYDHPTPLDGDSTLPRLLDSLAAQIGAPEFSVFVLVSAVGVEWEEAAQARVRGLLGPYASQLHLYLVDASTAELVTASLRAAGLDAPLTGMRGYAAVRNMQLLVPAAFGAEIIIALDDDETVSRDYLRTATELIGAEHDGRKLVGIAGLYADAEGQVLLPVPAQTGNRLLDKAVYMNEALAAPLAGPERLSPTPMALGGNMVFHRDLFARVGFDPGITRGEDIDYLVNARMAGFQFYLDRLLRITHLPPRHYEAPLYGKMRQDVLRFIYEREKIRAGALTPEVFDPYPGRLLREDLDDQAREALAATATPEMIARLGAPDGILAEARRRAQEWVPRYFAFAERWPAMVETVTRDEGLRHAPLQI
jgi:hypothetical protein